MPNWDTLTWTLVEGALPIIGVSLLFLVLGFSGAFSAEGEKFTAAWSKFRWRMAFDPIGWLYGSMLLAVHVFREGKDKHGALAYHCLALGVVAVVLLAQALNHRKERPTYDAPTRMQVFAVLMVVVVLVASYVVRADGGQKETTLVQAQAQPPHSREVRIEVPPEFKGEPKSNAALTTAITTAAGAVATGILAAAAGATAAPVAGAILLGGVMAAAASNKLRQGEPDVLLRSDGAQYIIERISHGDVKHFTDAVAQLRRYAREQPMVLYLAIRRRDGGGSPFMAEWDRKKWTAPFKGKWAQGVLPVVAQFFGEPPWMPMGRAARERFALLNRRDRLGDPPLSTDEHKELEDLLAAIAREGEMDDLASLR